MDAKHFSNFSIVRYTMDEDNTPIDATEVFVYRDVDEDVRKVLEEILEEMGFDCMDCYPDEGTEYNGHICSYWGRCEESDID